MWYRGWKRLTKVTQTGVSELLYKVLRQKCLEALYTESVNGKTGE